MSDAEAIDNCVLGLNRIKKLADGYAVVFGEFLDSIEPQNAVVDRFGVAHSAPVAEEGYQVWHARLLSGGNSGFQTFYDGIVIGFVVQSVWKLCPFSITHRTNQPVLFHDLPF